MPFIIKTNNVERLRITENGNVGIGLVNATEKLEINGGLKLNAITPGVSSNGTIIFDGNEFLMRKNGQWMSLVYKSPWDTNSVSVYTGRKVGIGVDDPKESLEISGGLKLGNYTNSKIKGDTTIAEDGTIIYDGNDLLGKVEGEWVSLTDGGSETELWNINATTSTVYCMSNKVGIGTNNAGANLHLKNISANDPELKMRYTHQYNSFVGWESYQIEPLTNDKGMGGTTKEVKISDIDIYNKWGILYFAIDGINKLGITSSTIQTGTRLLCEDDIISRKNIWVVEKVSIGKSYAYPGTWNEQFSVVGTTLLNGNVAIGTTETPANLSLNGKFSLGTNTATEKLNVKGNILVESSTSPVGDALKMEVYTTQHPNGSYNNFFKLSFSNNPSSFLSYQSNGSLILNSGDLQLFDENGASTIGLQKNGEILGVTKININTNGVKRIFEVYNTTTNKFEMVLTSDGKFWGREISVTIDNLPDYVFEKDYVLMDLKDVENFIYKNKHLPEVPTANEVATNGMNLGEMNVLLLKKTEELTLYLIEQSKQIETLQKQNEAQQLIINELINKNNK